MRSVRSEGTAPEEAARLVARLSGVPFRVNARDLPGSPDVVFPTEKVALFVNGCFWHRHRCARGRVEPRTNAEFWAEKFARNVRRDAIARRRLREMGWKVETIWECEA